LSVLTFVFAKTVSKHYNISFNKVKFFQFSFCIGYNASYSQNFKFSTKWYTTLCH